MCCRAITRDVTWLLHPKPSRLSLPKWHMQNLDKPFLALSVLVFVSLTQRKSHKLFRAVENSIEQCFAANIVQCCQQYCSACWAWISPHSGAMARRGHRKCLLLDCDFIEVTSYNWCHPTFENFITKLTNSFWSSR